jgi:HD-GYP domain-containing protein (c-di-GMP phosphodiesterase class II)
MFSKLEELARAVSAAPLQREAPFVAMVSVLANAIEARNTFNAGHTSRVAGIALAAAKRMGWESDRLRDIELGAIIHDIGQIAVSDAILTKTGPLTPEEEELVRRHPEIGAKMLDNVPDLGHLLPFVLHHHERYDGTGYPHRLCEEAIPMEARLLAAADALDAMTSSRPYREGLEAPTAMGELMELSGSQFDPMVVDAMVTAYCSGELDPFLSNGSHNGGGT